jgi:hypothetical protein
MPNVVFERWRSLSSSPLMTLRERRRRKNELYASQVRASALKVPFFHLLLSQLDEKGGRKEGDCIFKDGEDESSISFEVIEMEGELIEEVDVEDEDSELVVESILGLLSKEDEEVDEDEDEEVLLRMVDIGYNFF